MGFRRDDESNGAGRDPTGVGWGDQAGATGDDSRHRVEAAGEDERTTGQEASDRSEEEPPQPDDSALRALPVRRLRLADAEDDSVQPERGDLSGSLPRSAPPARAWHWVPLGALVALITTIASSAVLGAVLPEAEEALRRLTEAVAGIEGEEEKLLVVQAMLEGPHGPALYRALVGILVAFAAGLLLAGLIVGLTGRAGAVEAGLGTGTFTLLSMLFLGGGLSLWALPTPLLAFACGWIGAKLGLAIHSFRARRRES